MIEVSKEQLNEAEQLLEQQVLYRPQVLKGLETSIQNSNLGGVTQSAAEVLVESGVPAHLQERTLKFLNHVMAMGILIGSNLPKEGVN